MEKIVIIAVVIIGIVGAYYLGVYKDKAENQSVSQIQSRTEN